MHGRCDVIFTMLFQLDLITLFAIIGTMHGLFFAGHLWFRRKSTLSHKLLAGLLFVTSLRIAKNIIVHARSVNPDLPMSYELWRGIVNFGITNQFAIGPFFLLYFLSLTNRGFSLKRFHLYHFIPFVLLSLLSAVIPWPFWKYGGLWASYIHVLFYYLWAFWVFYSAWKQQRMVAQSASPSPESFYWMRNMLILGAILMVAYSPSLFHYVGYVGGAGLYAAGVYVASMIVLRENKIHANGRKYETNRLSGDKSAALKQHLGELMEGEKPYLSPDLTLPKLAASLSVSANDLSRVINEQFGKSYAEFVNGFRIEEAKRKLEDPSNRDAKIARVAFDCGFNSLSTFKTLFKKQTTQTPSRYRAGKVG